MQRFFRQTRRYDKASSQLFPLHISGNCTFSQIQKGILRQNYTVKRGYAPSEQSKLPLQRRLTAERKDTLISARLFEKTSTQFCVQRAIFAIFLSNKRLRFLLNEQSKAMLSEKNGIFRHYSAVSSPSEASVSASSSSTRSARIERLTFFFSLSIPIILASTT